LSKFIPAMKCQAGLWLLPLLLLLGEVRPQDTANIDGESLDLPRSGKQDRKVKNILNVKKRGVPCRYAGKEFCHRSVVQKYGRNYANICNDGTVSLMRTYPGYEGPKPCEKNGRTFCDGKTIETGSVFVEQTCDRGKLLYINKFTKRPFPKGKLSPSILKKLSTEADNVFAEETEDYSDYIDDATPKNKPTKKPKQPKRKPKPTKKPIRSPNKDLIPPPQEKKEMMMISFDSVNNKLAELEGVNILHCIKKFSICFIQIGPDA